MASTFILKRKTYAENDEQKKGGFGSTALKVGAGLAATAGAIYGAKKGMFGNKAQLWTNRRIMDVGRKLGKDSSIGQKLVSSGKQGTLDAIKGIRQSNAANIIKNGIAAS